MQTPEPVDPEEFYSRGATTLFSSQTDQRLSYYLYVPLSGLRPDAHIVVVQHGTERLAGALRDQYTEFAEEHGCLIVAPLFPAGLIDPTDLHNYKFISYRDIRFDLELLSIVEQVATRYELSASKFLLHGFSGGGQFAHRFLYLHPRRLAGVSIGAPGRVTLLDDSQPWWLGTQDFVTLFGSSPDLLAIRQVPIQMIVGDKDVETWETNNVGGSTWLPNLRALGNTRIERLDALRKNFEAHHIFVQFDLIEGLAHDGLGVAPQVQDFFAPLMRALNIPSG